MEKIFQAIERSGIEIAKLIDRDSFEYSDSANTSGDNQLKLDVESDKVIEKNFREVTSIRAISSEEKDGEVEINRDGKYLISYDPLDGSSLVDVNLSVGSIFGIYENSFRGSNLVASAYIVYGPRVEMVVAYDEVKLYRLAGEKFHFVKTLSLNEKGKIQAPGGTQKNWLPHHKKMVDDIFQQGYRLRYSGGMVPDLHQILLKGGGLFSYPATTDKPKGKLRILFEVLPFALVFEKAGGYGVDDKSQRLLNIEPQHLHDTSPCFFGSKYEISLLKKYYG
ncbi:MAG TPA: class 1 fructose-bisphosphatase [Campylobacterales bacterium]|nr:class 1 fructose-bisphosphatase [Campylobacterales bacterium]